MVARIARLALTAVASAVLILQASAQEASRSFSPEEEAAIGAIVRDYLIANPKVLVEALDALDAIEAREEAARQAAAIDANREALERDGVSFVAGNPDAAVTLVEFFDYRCPACKSAANAVRELIAERDDVRIVFKEFPILGPDSTLAARAAIAAIPLGDYEAFHFALMENEGTLDRDRIMEIAAEIGLDTDMLERGMDNARATEIIEKNYELAREIGVRGTPAFVIGTTLVPGAAPLAELEQLIEEERARLAEAG